MCWEVEMSEVRNVRLLIATHTRVEVTCTEQKFNKTV